MNFDFSEEQKLLQKTARDYLGAHAPLSLARSVLESDGELAEKLWQGAAEMGWLGAAIPEEHGGAGFGHLELALIAMEIGRALAPIPFASSVLHASEAIALAGSEAQKRHWLPKLASGEAIGCLAYFEGAGRCEAARLATRFEGGRLRGTKLPVADGSRADLAIVVAREGDDVSLVIAPLAADGVTRERLASLDPTRPQSRIAFDRAPAERLGEPGHGRALLSTLLDRAATLAAFEQLGGAERAFETTRDFCSNRYAFGRPIASFQALKHRLADLYVDLELARSNAYYAIWALHAGSADLATAACAARAAASDVFELAAREMIQLHGGVGFTWEYDCHLFYRRAKALAVALGSADEWRDRLVERLDSPASAV